MFPHCASLIAFEAMGGWGRQHQTQPTLDNLRYLNHLVVGLAEPYLDLTTGTAGDDVFESFLLRISFQQFPYQLPPFNDLARMRPMLKRSFPSADFRVMIYDLITELVGTEIDDYLDFGPFFPAAVMSNRGLFDPAWLDRPEMAAIAEDFPAALPPGAATAVFNRFLRAPAEFERFARDVRHADSRMRQYNFNPFMATPFVALADGAGLAPQPFFLTSRFAPSAIYYAGLDHFAGDLQLQNDFTKDCGAVNEAYTIDQLTQLKAIGLRVAGEVEYEPQKKSVDVTVELSDTFLMFEVKSSRPTLGSRASLVAYNQHLKRDLKKAIEQLVATYELCRGGHPAFSQIAPDLDVRAALPAAPYGRKVGLKMGLGHDDEGSHNVAIISFTELEQLVAEALREKSGRVLLEAAKSASPVMVADVAGALNAATCRQRGRYEPFARHVIRLSQLALARGLDLRAAVVSLRRQPS